MWALPISSLLTLKFKRVRKSHVVVASSCMQVHEALPQGSPSCTCGHTVAMHALHIIMPAAPALHAALAVLLG
jgi:hypothetical protein